MVEPGSDQEVVAHCYRHPDREANVRCTRCDRPICPECMRPASVGFHCPDDVASGRRTVRAKRTVVGARFRESRPYVTITIVALNVLAYLVTAFEPGGSLGNPTASKLFRQWQLFPPAIHNQDDYYQLITATFLHVSLLHIGANMLALIFVGPALESLLGGVRFAVLYLLSALGGSAAVYAFGGHYTSTAGASGAIFGLFGACLVLVRKLGLDAQWLITIIVLNFVFTFSVSHISKMGHIGGFVTGALVGLALGGLPSSRTRIDPKLQYAGMAGVAVLVAAVVGYGTVSW
ncbi:MAG TPA: rhomboid family intramembrane serine protease [Jatrophihabitans sp.]|nr:rhomboid family intramembrane serine protease [Jatrophihabitans sp.]